MNLKIQKLRTKMDAVQLPTESYSVSQLLEDYPELVFNPDAKHPKYIWHDFQKKVSVYGGKNCLKYELKDVLPLIDQELNFLLGVRISIKKILQLVKANRNKKLILLVLGDIYNMRITTGGGTSCAVRRIIMIYEREGGVTSSKKRKATPSEASDSDESYESDFDFLEELEDDDETVVCPSYSPPSPKKLKSWSETTTQPALVTIELRPDSLDKIYYASEGQALTRYDGFLYTAELQAELDLIEKSILDEFSD